MSQSSSSVSINATTSVTAIPVEEEPTTNLVVDSKESQIIKSIESIPAIQNSRKESIEDKKKSLILKKISNAFDIFDSQRNKTCDVREIGSIIRSLNIYPSEEKLLEWVKDMEEDEPTGFVKYDRFENYAYTLLTDIMVVRDDDEKIYRAFKTLDPDQKGFLRPEELKECLTTMGEKFTDAEFEEMLASCLDPLEGRVYYEDFVNILAQ